MAIRHKFYDWLTLPEELVDWEVEKLIVGTFNPDLVENNYADWFYGRVNRNHLWQILPELHNSDNLKCSSLEERIIFCKEQKIAFTDLITEIPNADSENENHLEIISKFRDRDIITHFGPTEELIWTDINRILNERESIKEIYLTNSGNDEWGKKFNTIERESDNNIHFSKLYTPSNFASLHMKRNGFNSVTEFIKYKWIEKGYRV